MSVAADAPPSPFKGLASFQDTELDALLFCGREREREVVVANLLASRLTVLYGASGVGKTSLLRAAVAHSLRQAHDAAVVLASSWAGDPRRGLGDAIDDAVGIETRGTLAERLAAAAGAVGGDVYVILDQFEEYFLYHEGDAFESELADAIRDPALRANFLLGLREDALAKLDAFKGRIPNLFANYLRLDHLDRRGARAAVLGPVERYNELTGEQARVEPELVEAVLDQAAAGKVDVGRAGRGGVETDEERIEAPYLQLVLERLWEVERARGSSVLRLATLYELGGAESIVRAHLERALGRLQPAEQDIAAMMFDHLVTPSGSKIAHRPRDLAQYAAVGETDVLPVLEALGHERIVRAVDGAGGGERYEIFHDVLADGVLAWRARQVLERDREKAHERQRRLAIVAGLALVALTAMTAVAIFALTERSHARSAARQARARALEATALADLSTLTSLTSLSLGGGGSGDPQRALDDAVAAARMDPGPRAEAVLRKALVEDHLRRVLSAPGSVSAVGFAPRGGRMLTAGGDRLRIYSADGRIERDLSLGAPVIAASFSRKGDLIMAAGGREARLWSAATGAPLYTLRLPGRATSATFSQDGRLLLTTSLGGSTVWSTASGRTLAVLASRPAARGAISPSGRLVATLDRVNPSKPAICAGKVVKNCARVRVFDSRGGRLQHVLAPPAELEGAVFSPDGPLLATPSYRGAYLWNVRTGRPVGPPLEDGKYVENDAEFSPDGASLAVAGEDGSTRVWDVRSGQRSFYLPGHTNPVLAVTWSPDGRFVVDASRDRSIHVWAVEGPLSSQIVGNLVGHREAVNAIAWSPDGNSLLSGSAGGTARLWDATQFDQKLRLLGTHHGRVLTASFGPGGRRVVSAGVDGTARIWDVRSGRQVDLLSHGGPVEDAEFSPDGRLVVTASADRTARIWSGARVLTLHADAPVLVARFAPDGALVMTGDDRGHVQLWRTRDGRLLATGGQRGGVEDAAFARDGRTLATAGRDGVSIWSVPSGRRVHPLSSPRGVSAVAFSPDGLLVAAAGKDGSARIWDAETGQLRGVFKVSAAPLRDVVFSPDGRVLLATGADNQTWNVRTRKMRHTLVGHTGRVVAGAFSPDGRWIATAGPMTVGLWQSDGERPYFYLRNPDLQPGKFLTGVSFSPNGRLVLSSSEDGSVRLYRCKICGNLRALMKLASERLLALRG